MPSLPLPAGARYLSLDQIRNSPTGLVVADVRTNGLFSPLQPVTPLAPAGEYFRQRQLVPGENLIWQPKGNEFEGFYILRAFADSCDLLRMVINTVLDKLTFQPWELRLTPQPGEKVKDLQARQSNDPRIKAVSRMLRKPDGVHHFPQWMRMLWEDSLVIDAAVVWKERDLKGRIANFRPLDGGTFNVLVTEQGFQPPPPSPAHQQVLYGLPWFNASTDDITYIVRHPRTWKRYGFSEVEGIFTTIGIALREQDFTQKWYTDGNIPEALCFLPADLPIDKVKEVQDWFDTILAGDLGKRRRLTFLPGYGKSSDSSKPNVMLTKQELLKNPLAEWLFQIFCYHFGTTPQAMMKMVNRATAQQNAESAEEEGLIPKMREHKIVMDSLIQDDLGYQDIEFVWQERRETDLLKQAQIDNIYVGKVITVNEARNNLGKDPIKVPEADMLGEFTLQGFVPLAAPEQANRAKLMATATQKPSEEDDDEPPPKNGKKQPTSSKKKATTQLLLKRLGARIEPGKLTLQSQSAKSKISETVHKVFQRQKDRASQEVSRLLKASTPTNAGKSRIFPFAKESDDKTPDEIADAIYTSLESEWSTLPAQLRPQLEAAMLSGIADAMIDIQISDANLISSSNAVAAEYASKRAAEMVGMAYDAEGNLIPNPNAEWVISETTRKEIRQIVTDAFLEETNKADIADAILVALGNESNEDGIFSEGRANMIASTEVANAQVGGNWTVWQKSGIVLKVKWLTSEDDNVCEICAGNDNFEVEFGQPFPSGDLRPTAHPRCQCILVVTKVLE